MLVNQENGYSPLISNSNLLNKMINYLKMSIIGKKWRCPWCCKTRGCPTWRTLKFLDIFVWGVSSVRLEVLLRPSLHVALQILQQASSASNLKRVWPHNGMVSACHSATTKFVKLSVPELTKPNQRRPFLVLWDHIWCFVHANAHWLHCSLMTTVHRFELSRSSIHQMKGPHYIYIHSLLFLHSSGNHPTFSHTLAVFMYISIHLSGALPRSRGVMLLNWQGFRRGRMGEEEGSQGRIKTRGRQTWGWKRGKCREDIIPWV